MIDDEKNYQLVKSSRKMDNFFLELIRSLNNDKDIPKGCLKMPKRLYKPIIEEAYKENKRKNNQSPITKKRFKSVPSGFTRASINNLKLNPIFNNYKRRVIWKDLKISREQNHKIKYEKDILEFYSIKDKSKESTTLKSENNSNISGVKNKINDENIKTSSFENANMNSNKNIDTNILKNKNKLKGIVNNRISHYHFLDVNAEEDNPRQGVKTAFTSPQKKKTQLLLNFKGDKIMNNKKFIKKIKKQFNLQIEKVKFAKFDKKLASKN